MSRVAARFATTVALVQTTIIIIFHGSNLSLLIVKVMLCIALYKIFFEFSNSELKHFLITLFFDPKTANVSIKSTAVMT